MALAPSSLAQVCRRLADDLSEGINGTTTTRISVLLGTPAAAAPADSDNDHRLNLFFFRFEASGLQPDVLPGETWLLRAHCLVTPFCVDEPPLSAGENDLRAIGEVMRHFHERPVFEIEVDGQAFLIQVVFLNLGLEQINQLWSTQGDTAYRPSVLFEVSLAPVIPRRPAVQPPRVGALGVEASPGIAARPPAGAATPPPVPVMRPNTAAEQWTPGLCLVTGGACHLSVSLALGSAELAGLAPAAWVAGAVGSEVRLRWEVWDSVTGWRSLPAGAPLLVQQDRIDPAAVAAAALEPVALPFNDRPGQAVLYAERIHTRAADRVRLTLRSNPVLVTLYEAAP
ncbi:MAG: Pvc16 family protein [Burkholderiales bacterium]|nr:Pvc16 family protein [Burkholderiales bacterium]